MEEKADRIGTILIEGSTNETADFKWDEDLLKNELY